MAGVAVATVPGATDVVTGWMKPKSTSPAPLAAVVAAPLPAVPTGIAQPQPPSPPPETVTALPQPAASEDDKKENAPQPITSIEWPNNVSRTDSEMLAFGSLFKLYGITNVGSSKGAPCRRAEELGMRCYVARGGLSDLFLLDQPVVMRLTSADGSEYSATLGGLDHQVATLVIGGTERRVALTDLANAWSGNFVLIWKAPPAFRDPLSLSQRGPAVNWLRQAMTSIDGIPDDGTGTFDAALARRIRAFQLAEGIRPDGFVGPLTAIRINVRSGQGGPHLVTGKKG